MMNTPVLLYHSISDTSTRLYQPWAVSPAMFDQQMAYLQSHGYQPLTVSRMVNAVRSEGERLPDKPVLITFDDGLADYLEGAQPILKKYGFSSTLYITTDYVGKTSSWLADLGEQNRPMLNWEQIKNLENVELGGHSLSHPQMDLLPLDQARREVAECKMVLEAMTGKPVNSFAFPHGYHTQKLLDAVRESGYTSACIVGHSMARDQGNIFAIPRIIINSDISVEKFDNYLRGVGLRQSGVVQNTLRKTWRTVRWIRSISTR